MDLDLNTFAGWAADGRYVRSGEKAQHYGRTPVDFWYALFHRDQTDERPTITIEDVVEIKTTEEHRATSNDTRPKLKLDYSDGTVNLWVGNNTRALAIVKQSGYRFNPQRHRWSKPRNDPRAIATALEEAGFNVQVTGDLPAVEA